MSLFTTTKINKQDILRVVDESGSTQAVPANSTANSGSHCFSVDSISLSSLDGVNQGLISDQSPEYQCEQISQCQRHAHHLMQLNQHRKSLAYISAILHIPLFRYSNDQNVPVRLYLQLLENIDSQNTLFEDLDRDVCYYEKSPSYYAPGCSHRCAFDFEKQFALVRVGPIDNVKEAKGKKSKGFRIDWDQLPRIRTFLLGVYHHNVTEPNSPLQMVPVIEVNGKRYIPHSPQVTNAQHASQLRSAFQQQFFITHQLYGKAVNATSQRGQLYAKYLHFTLFTIQMSTLALKTATVQVFPVLRLPVFAQGYATVVPDSPLYSLQCQLIFKTLHSRHNSFKASKRGPRVDTAVVTGKVDEISLSLNRISECMKSHCDIHISPLIIDSDVTLDSFQQCNCLVCKCLCLLLGVDEITEEMLDVFVNDFIIHCNTIPFTINTDNSLQISCAHPAMQSVRTPEYVSSTFEPQAKHWVANSTVPLESMVHITQLSHRGLPDIQALLGYTSSVESTIEILELASLNLDEQILPSFLNHGLMRIYQLLKLLPSDTSNNTTNNDNEEYPEERKNVNSNDLISSFISVCGLQALSNVPKYYEDTVDMDTLTTGSDSYIPMFVDEQEIMLLSVVEPDLPYSTNATEALFSTSLQTLYEQQREHQLTTRETKPVLDGGEKTMITNLQNTVNQAEDRILEDTRIQVGLFDQDTPLYRYEVQDTQSLAHMNLHTECILKLLESSEKHIQDTQKVLSLCLKYQFLVSSSELAQLVTQLTKLYVGNYGSMTSITNMQYKIEHLVEGTISQQSVTAVMNEMIHFVNLQKQGKLLHCAFFHYTAKYLESINMIDHAYSAMYTEVSDLVDQVHKVASRLQSVGQQGVEAILTFTEEYKTYFPSHMVAFSKFVSMHNIFIGNLDRTNIDNSINEENMTDRNANTPVLQYKPISTATSSFLKSYKQLPSTPEYPVLLCDSAQNSLGHCFRSKELYKSLSKYNSCQKFVRIEYNADISELEEIPAVRRTENMGKQTVVVDSVPIRRVIASLYVPAVNFSNQPIQPVLDSAVLVDLTAVLATSFEAINSNKHTSNNVNIPGVANVHKSTLEHIQSLLSAPETVELLPVFPDISELTVYLEKTQFPIWNATQVVKFQDIVLAHLYCLAQSSMQVLVDPVSDFQVWVAHSQRKLGKCWIYQYIVDELLEWDGDSLDIHVTAVCMQYTTLIECLILIQEEQGWLGLMDTCLDYLSIYRDTNGVCHMLWCRQMWCCLRIHANKNDALILEPYLHHPVQCPYPLYNANAAFILSTHSVTQQQPANMTVNHTQANSPRHSFYTTDANAELQDTVKWLDVDTRTRLQSQNAVYQLPGGKLSATGLHGSYLDLEPISLLPRGLEKVLGDQDILIAHCQGYLHATQKRKQYKWLHHYLQDMYMDQKSPDLRVLAMLLHARAAQLDLLSHCIQTELTRTLARDPAKEQTAVLVSCSSSAAPVVHILLALADTQAILQRMHKASKKNPLTILPDSLATQIVHALHSCLVKCVLASFSSRLRFQKFSHTLCPGLASLCLNGIQLLHSDQVAFKLHRHVQKLVRRLPQLPYAVLPILSEKAGACPFSNNLTLPADKTCPPLQFIMGALTSRSLGESSSCFLAWDISEAVEYLLLRSISIPVNNLTALSTCPSRFQVPYNLALHGVLDSPLRVSAVYASDSPFKPTKKPSPTQQTHLSDAEAVKLWFLEEVPMVPYSPASCLSSFVDSQHQLLWVAQHYASTIITNTAQLLLALYPKVGNGMSQKDSLHALQHSGDQTPALLSLITLLTCMLPTTPVAFLPLILELWKLKDLLITTEFAVLLQIACVQGLPVYITQESQDSLLVFILEHLNGQAVCPMYDGIDVTLLYTGIETSQVVSSQAHSCNSPLLPQFNFLTENSINQLLLCLQEEHMDVTAFQEYAAVFYDKCLCDSVLLKKDYIPEDAAVIDIHPYLLSKEAYLAGTEEPYIRIQLLKLTEDILRNYLTCDLPVSTKPILEFAYPPVNPLSYSVALQAFIGSIKTYKAELNPPAVQALCSYGLTTPLDLSKLNTRAMTTVGHFGSLLPVLGDTTELLLTIKQLLPMQPYIHQLAFLTHPTVLSVLVGPTDQVYFPLFDIKVFSGKIKELHGYMCTKTKKKPSLPFWNATKNAVDIFSVPIHEATAVQALPVLHAFVWEHVEMLRTNSDSLDLSSGNSARLDIVMISAKLAPIAAALILTAIITSHSTHSDISAQAALELGVSALSIIAMSQCILTHVAELPCLPQCGPYPITEPSGSSIAMPILTSKVTTLTSPWMIAYNYYPDIFHSPLEQRVPVLDAHLSDVNLLLFLQSHKYSAISNISLNKPMEYTKDILYAMEQMHLVDSKAIHNGDMQLSFYRCIDKYTQFLAPTNNYQNALQVWYSHSVRIGDQYAYKKMLEYVQCELDRLKAVTMLQCKTLPNYVPSRYTQLIILLEQQQVQSPESQRSYIQLKLAQLKTEAAAMYYQLHKPYECAEDTPIALVSVQMALENMTDELLYIPFITHMSSLASVVAAPLLAPVDILSVQPSVEEEEWYAIINNTDFVVTDTLNELQKILEASHYTDPSGLIDQHAALYVQHPVESCTVVLQLLLGSALASRDNTLLQFIVQHLYLFVSRYVPTVYVPQFHIFNTLPVVTTVNTEPNVYIDLVFTLSVISAVCLHSNMSEHLLQTIPLMLNSLVVIKPKATERASHPITLLTNLIQSHMHQIIAHKLLIYWDLYSSELACCETLMNAFPMMIMSGIQVISNLRHAPNASASLGNISGATQRVAVKGPTIMVLGYFKTYIKLNCLEMFLSQDIQENSNTMQLAHLLSHTPKSLWNKILTTTSDYTALKQQLETLPGSEIYTAALIPQLVTCPSMFFVIAVHAQMLACLQRLQTDRQFRKISGKTKLDAVIWGVNGLMCDLPSTPGSSFLSLLNSTESLYQAIEHDPALPPISSLTVEYVKGMRLHRMGLNNPSPLDYKLVLPYTVQALLPTLENATADQAIQTGVGLCTIPGKTKKTSYMAQNGQNYLGKYLANEFYAVGNWETVFADVRGAKAKPQELLNFMLQIYSNDIHLCGTRALFQLYLQYNTTANFLPLAILSAGILQRTWESFPVKAHDAMVVFYNYISVEYRGLAKWTEQTVPRVPESLEPPFPPLSMDKPIISPPTQVPNDALKKKKRASPLQTTTEIVLDAPKKRKLTKQKQTTQELQSENQPSYV